MRSDGKNLADRVRTPALEAALLVMIAGYADAIGFLQFRAFAGQMTGNTILLAISIIEAGWLEALFYVAVIAAFLIGVVISGGLVRLGWAPAVPLSAVGGGLGDLRVRDGAMGRAAAGLRDGRAERGGHAFRRRHHQHRVHHRRSAEAVPGGARLALARRWSGETPPGLVILALVWVEYFVGALLGASALFALAYPLLIPAPLLPFVLLGRRGACH